jgi:hypothetical protein
VKWPGSEYAEKPDIARHAFCRDASILANAQIGCIEFSARSLLHMRTAVRGPNAPFAAPQRLRQL